MSGRAQFSNAKGSHHPGDLPGSPPKWMLNAAQDLLNRIETTVIDPIQQRLDDHPGVNAQFGVKGLLLGLVMTAMRKQDMHMRIAWQNLLSLPRGDAKRLNVLDDNGHWLTYHQITQLFRRVLDATERLEQETDIKPAFNAAGDKLTFALWINESLIRASVEGAAMRGHVALDGTDIETWARTLFRDEREDGETYGYTPTDPNAGRGHRPARNDRSAGVFSGYEAHFVTTAEQGLPILILGMSFATASTPKHSAALDLVLRLHEHWGIEMLRSDRGYTMQKAADWAIPLAQAGIQQAMALSEAQRGVRPLKNGALLIDGWPHSPATPVRLHKLKAITDRMTAEERTELARIYDERDAYAWKIHSIVSPGRYRLSPPCEIGHVRCSLKPRSLALPYSRPTAQPPQPPEPCCSQRTMTFTVADSSGLLQKYRYGTTDWVKAYYMRNLVETANSMIKTHYAGVHRGTIRYRAGKSIGMLIGIVVAAVNLRTLRKWRRDNKVKEPFPDLTLDDPNELYSDVTIPGGTPVTLTTRRRP